MAEMKAKEIFAVGTWNGLEFTEDDLDDIVENFEALKDVHRVPLKFGHNDEQPLTDGQPAIGWVKRVYRQGKKLLADFADVPGVVVDAIKKRLYRTVSVELLLGVEHKGRTINNLLDAVALLGADQPAVNTLQDLSTLLATRAEFSGGHRFSCNTIRGKGVQRVTMEEFDMDKNEVQDLINSALEPVKEQNKKLMKRNEELEGEIKKRDEESERRERREKEERVTLARREVNDVLDLAVKCGSMTPAVRETYARQIGVADDDRVVDIDVDQIKTMFSVKEEQPKSGGAARSGSEDEDDRDAAEQLDSKTKEFMARHNVSDYRVAFSRVAAAHPDLHREYLDSNGIKS